jgi:hypothetical protein
MQLVEQHIIRASSPQFEAIDAAAFAAKNLYNAANYLVRQSFINEGQYLTGLSLNVEYTYATISARMCGCLNSAIR